MLEIILKFLLKFAASETAKELVLQGTKKLVESTDNGIDDALAKNILGDIAKSKRNSIRQNTVAELCDSLGL